VQRDSVEIVSDILVRTVLSHVMQPASDSSSPAAHLARATTRLLVS
jgi:hypothetical protein